MADTLRAMPDVALEDVLVAPEAVDTRQWLLLNPDLQIELEGAVHNLYDFKFDRAERQFRSLRRRYPNHPMAYFLMGLSTWWKIMPSNTIEQQYDKRFFAYMDTAATKAQALYDTDNNNYEAAFFLSAAYGFDARLHAERRDWRKATVSSRRSLTYLQKSRQANGLSPEFLFGEALFNYYAVWIGEQYPLLKPVLLFFPKGNRQTGLTQLAKVANNAFYTGPEARFFQMRILASAAEDNTAGALTAARALAHDFPDNSCFQRTYATACFAEGQLTECETVCRSLLAKAGLGLPGYDGFSGRVATYYLGYLEQYRYGRPAEAQNYYQRCIVFCESVSSTDANVYLFAVANLGRLAAKAHDVATARRYFKRVLVQAEHRSDLYREARAYLKETPAATQAGPTASRKSEDLAMDK